MPANLLAWAGVTVVVVAGVAVYAARSRLVAVPLCVAESVPEQARLVRDTWVWLERREGNVSVVSMHAGRRIVIATHDEVASLSTSKDAVAWIGKDGDAWTIRRAGLDGSNVTEFARVDGTPLAVWTDGQQVLWAVDRGPSSSVAEFIPPLGSRTEIRLAVGTAGQPIAEIAERFAEAHILGKRNGTVYLAGVRAEGIRCTVLYAIGADSPPRRFAGEVGAHSAMMTEEGSVYWTGPSRGSNSLLTGCIRAARPDSLEPQTIADWLPAGGRLHATTRGLVVTGAGTETAWRVLPSARLGEPLPMLPDQWPVAAGGDLLLTVHRAKTPGRVAVSTVRMP